MEMDARQAMESQQPAIILHWLPGRAAKAAAILESLSEQFYDAPQFEDRVLVLLRLIVSSAPARPEVCFQQLVTPAKRLMESEEHTRTFARYFQHRMSVDRVSARVDVEGAFTKDFEARGYSVSEMVNLAEDCHDWWRSFERRSPF